MQDNPTKIQDKAEENFDKKNEADVELAFALNNLFVNNNQSVSDPHCNSVSKESAVDDEGQVGSL